MESGGSILLGIAGGYLLGRSRKTKLALVLGALLARKRVGGMASDVLGSSPELAKLVDSVRGQLIEAGKSAAVSAASHRMDSFSDMLQQHAESLRTPPGPATPEATPEPEEGPPDEKESGPEAPEEEPAEEAPPQEEEREDRPPSQPARTEARPHRARPSDSEGRHTERAAARSRGSGTRRRPSGQSRERRDG